jgi:hypothetical protein
MVDYFLIPIYILTLSFYLKKSMVAKRLKLHTFVGPGKSIVVKGMQVDTAADHTKLIVVQDDKSDLTLMVYII